MRLEAINLAFGYDGRPVGVDLSLIVQPGEIVCLLGPNGCGKTTLFKTLLGLLPAQGGYIAIGEDKIVDLSRAEIARRIAYVPQARDNAFPYTAFDLVLMGRVAHRGLFAAPTVEDRRVSHAALETLGIGELASREITTLSGGQRQLVIVARAMAQSASLIVMDEPTASLDFGNQVAVLAEVRALAARGTGVILSTHDPGQAFALASRVALMQDGRIVAQGPPTDVLTPSRLKDVYGVDVTVDTLTSGQTVCAPIIRLA